MPAKPMANMCEIGLFGTDPLCKSNRLIQREMRNVCISLKRIDNQYFATDNFFHLTLFDGFCIGNIGKVANTEAQYRHHIMHYFNGNYLMPEEMEGLGRDFMEGQYRYTGI